MHKIITETIDRVAPEVGSGLINLVTTRQGVDDLLDLDDVIDLVSVINKECITLGKLISTSASALAVLSSDKSTSSSIPFYQHMYELT